MKSLKVLLKEQKQKQKKKSEVSGSVSGTTMNHNHTRKVLQRHGIKCSFHFNGDCHDYVAHYKGHAAAKALHSHMVDNNDEDHRDGEDEDFNKLARHARGEKD